MIVFLLTTRNLIIQILPFILVASVLYKKIEIFTIWQHIDEFWPHLHCAYAKMAIYVLLIKTLTPCSNCDPEFAKEMDILSINLHFYAFTTGLCQWRHYVFG